MDICPLWGKVDFGEAISCSRPRDASDLDRHSNRRTVQSRHRRIHPVARLNGYQDTGDGSEIPRNGSGCVAIGLDEEIGGKLGIGVGRLWEHPDGTF